MPEYPEQTYSIDDELIEIVSTPDTLGGAPRLDGHHIAVYHILSFYRDDHNIEDIAGDAVYPHLSEAQVRAALHYAIDYPEAVERSSQPRDTPLMMVVSFDSRKGGPTLSVFDRESNEPGAIAEMTLSIDELPDGYSVQDLYAAWVWMHEVGDRPDQSNGLGDVDEADRREGGSISDAVKRLDDAPSWRELTDPLSDEEAAELEALIKKLWEGSALTDAGEPLSDAASSQEHDRRSFHEDRHDITDINQRVRAEWVDETEPYERILQRLPRHTEPRSAETIANLAQVSLSEATRTLQLLASIGYASTWEAKDDDTRYRRSTEAAVLDRARTIRDSVSAEDLDERIEELESELFDYRSESGFVTLDDALQNKQQIDYDLLQDWKRLRNNLGAARVAAALNVATEWWTVR